MQWIDGDVVGGDVGGEILRGPVDDGIDLHERAFLVPGGERRGCPLVGMLAPDAGDPALRALKLAGQRPHFAHLTAALRFSTEFLKPNTPSRETRASTSLASGATRRMRMP